MISYKYPSKIIHGTGIIKGEEIHIHAFGNDFEGFEAYISYIENDVEVIVNNIIGTWEDIKNLINKIDPHGTEIKFEVDE